MNDVMADKTAGEWKRQHSQGEVPSDIFPLKKEYYFDDPTKEDKLINVIHYIEEFLYKDNGLSKAEIKRRIKDGAVEFNGKKIKDIHFTITEKDTGIVKYGKRKYFKIV